MAKYITCAILTFILLTVSLTVGWLLYGSAYNAGRLDPDWTKFHMWIDPDYGEIGVENENGYGCTWVIDESMFVFGGDPDGYQSERPL